MSGDPEDWLRHVAADLADAGATIEGASRLYLTEPVGGVRQPPFVNAVIEITSDLPPSSLLAAAKMIERRSGRRRGRRNGPRPIDIDILDYAGRVLGAPTAWLRGAPRSRLVLPHPELHRRRFMLQPLFDLAPHWHHPVLDRSIRQLISALPIRAGGVQPILDSDWISCQKATLSNNDRLSGDHIVDPRTARAIGGVRRQRLF